MRNTIWTRMLEWIGKPEDEKIKKLITKEKNFWSDQLRKANAVDGISYGSGIVGVKYSVIEKAQHLIDHLETKEDER